MGLSFHIFRKYRGGLLSGNPSIEITRAVVELYELYRDLLALNNKRKSDVEALQKTLMQLQKVDPSKKRDLIRVQKKVMLKTQDDFYRSLANVEKMMRDLSTITYADQRLIFREVNFINHLLTLVYRLHIHHEQKQQANNFLQNMLREFVKLQYHYWVVAKAQSRGFTKLEELSILGTRSQKRHLKLQAIEARQLHDIVDKLVVELDTIQDQQKLMEHLGKLFEYLRIEFDDLYHIMHESKVLIRTTQNLFKQICHEARAAKLSRVESKARDVEKIFNKLLHKIQQQALREYNDIRIMQEQRTAA
ncbi:hypothetical protein HZB03_00070 [Candidatus Woesearchaeota archaeon]|nr:hypothetical protein [Candidatus Woesearchaeota archaeon]